MKVRFSNPKETRPTSDQGLEVLYAPARRSAFRFRWYLILLLITSPFLFFAGKFIHGLLIVEVPAQVIFPLSELRARDTAQVTGVKVKEGQTVQPGQLLVEMDNREWRLRLEQLKALTRVQSETSLAAGQSVEEVLNSQLARAEERLALLIRLMDQGAATRGEVMDAANLRDRLLLERLTFQQQETRLAEQVTASSNVSQLDAERVWLENRLNELALHANEEGLVTEILVREGENVGPGTPIIQVRNPSDARIYAYIGMDQAHHARAGEPMCIKLPDGEIVRGHIAGPPQNAASVPADIRAAFASRRRDLLVTVETEQALPVRWLVQNLPLQIRFRCGRLLNALW